MTYVTVIRRLFRRFSRVQEPVTTEVTLIGVAQVTRAEAKARVWPMDAEAEIRRALPLQD